MKLNEHTCIFGDKAVLVPYKKKHVPRYHKWMEDANLQQLTASEPLSLEEEYAMQLSWLNDENKCTFIVLCRQLYEETECDEVASMVGDVNLFLNDVDNHHHAEIEVMIAEPSSRGRGLGLEATLAMMYYGVAFLGIRHFIAKIGYQNTRSLELFKKLGFVEKSRSDVFKEATLHVDVSEQFSSWLREQTSSLVISEQ